MENEFQGFNRGLNPNNNNEQNEGEFYDLFR